MKVDIVRHNDGAHDADELLDLIFVTVLTPRYKQTFHDVHLTRNNVYVLKIRADD